MSGKYIVHQSNYGRKTLKYNIYKIKSYCIWNMHEHDSCSIIIYVMVYAQIDNIQWSLAFIPEKRMMFHTTFPQMFGPSLWSNFKSIGMFIILK